MELETVMVDWESITKNPEVKNLLITKLEIDKQIYKLDKQALINFELFLLENSLQKIKDE